MTAAPISPGRGLPVYQPATATVPGTCRLPAAVRPSLTSPVRMPIAGMKRATGAATVTGCAASGNAPARPAGTATNGLAPAASAGRPPWLATSRPPSAAAHTIPPQAAAAAAAGCRATRDRSRARLRSSLPARRRDPLAGGPGSGPAAALPASRCRPPGPREPVPGPAGPGPAGPRPAAPDPGEPGLPIALAGPVA